MGYPMFRQTHFWFKDVLMFQNRGFYWKRLGKTRIQCDLTHKHDILAKKCGLYQPHRGYDMGKVQTTMKNVGIFKMVQSHSPKRPMAQWSSLEHQSRYGSSSYKWTYITSYNHSSRDECPMKPPFIVDFPIFSHGFPLIFPMIFPWGAAKVLLDISGVASKGKASGLPGRVFRQADAVRTYFTGIRLQNVFLYCIILWSIHV